MFVVQFAHLGCYGDNKIRAIPIREDIVAVFDGPVHTNRVKAIEKCAFAAKKRGFGIFGVQYGGQCATGTDEEAIYDKYGPATVCQDGKGGGYANDVYVVLFAGNRKLYNN